jgi:hypothetical protein
MDMNIKIGIVVLVVVIVVSILGSCSNFAPYDGAMKYSKVEGFESNTSDKVEAGSDVQVDSDKLEEEEEEEVVETFQGLTPASYDENVKIDAFGNAVGKPECAKESSGLSKSSGPLCLTEEHKRLLRTRGGNAGGVEKSLVGYSW